MRATSQPGPTAHSPVWLLVTAAYLAAGIITFKLGERTARTRGTIGSYRVIAHQGRR